MKKLFFTCDVVPDSQLEVLIDDDGEAAFLINNGATGEGGCVGEVCINREQTVRLRNWLSQELRRTMKA